MTFIFLPHLSIIAYVNSATHYDIMLWLFSLKNHDFNEGKQSCFLYNCYFLSNYMSQKLLSNWNRNVSFGLLQEEKAKPLLYKVQM